MTKIDEKGGTFSPIYSFACFDGFSDIYVNIICLKGDRGVVTKYKKLQGEPKRLIDL